MGALAIIGAVGTLMSVVGQVQQGNAADKAAGFEAKQLAQQAGQERAASQRSAAEERRQARLVQSRLQAVAGGGGMDPTVVGLSADIEAEGEYRALTSIFEGEEKARGMEMGAAATRFDGKSAKRASRFGAAATILGRGSSLYGKYGGDGLGSITKQAGTYSGSGFQVYGET